MIGKNDIERFEIIRDVCVASDRIMKVWAGPKLLLVTSHPDIIHQILTSPQCLEKPFLYRFAGFEQGLFTAKCMLPDRERKTSASECDQKRLSFNCRLLQITFGEGRESG